MRSPANFSGVWEANLEKSQLKGPAPRRITVTIAHEGDTIDQRIRLVPASGDEQTIAFRFQTTGAATPVTYGGNVGETHASWQGSTLIVETRLTAGERELQFRDHWSLSPDGNVLTMAHPDDVLAGQVSILERSSPEQRPAEAPRGRRHPTSHERIAGRPWDASYHDGPPPWDIGRPQPAVVRLAAGGAFSGSVLDAGCGSGENALHLAALGCHVLGIDVADTAVAIARKKAADRGLDAEFATADALHLERLGRTFRTALDCGLFHTFDGAERARYVASLASVTEPGGTAYVLCFSDRGLDGGPHPISEQELREAFTLSRGWTVASIVADRLETRIHDAGASAWLATIART